VDTPADRRTPARLRSTPSWLITQLGEAISELAEQELVVRAPDPADRRRNVITITEAGMHHLERLSTTLDGVQDALLAPLSPAERSELTELLSRVLDHHTGSPPAGAAWEPGITAG
jgi:MarR family transcriptional regulator, lower aerobic nicotinate degradation pathway regulator